MMEKPLHWVRHHQHHPSHPHLHHSCKILNKPEISYKSEFRAWWRKSFTVDVCRCLGYHYHFTKPKSKTRRKPPSPPLSPSSPQNFRLLGNFWVSRIYRDSITGSDMPSALGPVIIMIKMITRRRAHIHLVAARGSCNMHCHQVSTIILVVIMVTVTVNYDYDNV